MASNKTVVQVDMDESNLFASLHPKERKNLNIQRGRRLAVRWGLAILCILLLGFLLVWGFIRLNSFLFKKNPHFVFRELHFEDTTHFTARNIQTYLEELGEDNGGCVIGRTNLLTLDLKKLRQAFLANPIIENVEIRHILPGTLDIHLKERTPIAFVCHSRAANAFIDEHGIVFPRYDNKGIDNNLPFITDVQNADHLPMGTKSEDKFLLAAVDFINEVAIRPQIDGAAFTPYVIKINYTHEYLACMLKPLFTNSMFPEGYFWINIPCDKEKMLEAFDRLDTILKIKLKDGSTLYSADLTLQYNVKTQDEKPKEPEKKTKN